MDYFNKIKNPNEARLIYRRLAMINHPDMGGDPEVMKKINLEYQQYKTSVRKTQPNFFDIRFGDIVIINGSESVVTSVNHRTFTARSNITGRIGEFYKDNGKCTSSNKFIAASIKKQRHA